MSTLDPIAIATIGYVCDSVIDPIARGTHGYICPRVPPEPPDRRDGDGGSGLRHRIILEPGPPGERRDLRRLAILAVMVIEDD